MRRIGNAALLLFSLPHSLQLIHLRSLSFIYFWKKFIFSIFEISTLKIAATKEWQAFRMCDVTKSPAQKTKKTTDCRRPHIYWWLPFNIMQMRWRSTRYDTQTSVSLLFGYYTSLDSFFSLQWLICIFGWDDYVVAAATARWRPHRRIIALTRFIKCTSPAYLHGHLEINRSKRHNSNEQTNKQTNKNRSLRSSITMAIMSTIDFSVFFFFRVCIFIPQISNGKSKLLKT